MTSTVASSVGRPLALPRVPLVPDDLLKHNKAFCRIDPRFRAAARLLQALWLKDQNIPTGSLVYRNGDDVLVTEFGSILSEEAADAGKNFLTPAIYNLVLRELLMREEGAAIDEERLFANALSSMPLVFNLFGPLAMDRELATRVFRQLLPEFVKTVEHISFEHSPGRREERFLHDGTAFDIAVHVTTLEGEHGTIYVEVKYSEDLSGPAARHRPRYDEASRQVRLYTDPDDPLLRSVTLEQIFREHALAQLAVDQQVTSRAVFMAIGPRLNRRVQTAFRAYKTLLIEPEDRDANRVLFEPITLELIIDAIGQAGDSELSHALWARYCDFERIYRTSISELCGGEEAPANKPAEAASNATKPSDCKQRPRRLKALASAPMKNGAGR